MLRIDWLVSEMNILGGAEMFVRLAAPRLRALGWDLRLITLSKGGELIDQLKALSVPVVEFEVDKLNLFDAVSLFQTLKKDKPLLLQTHLYHAGIAGRLFGRLAGIRSIIVQQQGPEHGRSKRRSWLDGQTSRLVDRYVVTCEAVSLILQNREHIPGNKITVIPNGIDIKVFQQKPKKPDLWPIFSPAPVIGAVGRLSPEKGHHLLVEALSILRQRGKEFYAVIIGDGASKDDLLHQTKDLRLEDHISWVGKQTNIHQWLPFMDVFALPSHWEGISLALLEAMAAGLPVVATNVGGNPEVVVDGRTGFLTAPSDPAHLAEAIGRLIDEPVLRLEMGHLGKIRCLEHFDIDVIVNHLDALYKKLLAADANAA